MHVCAGENAIENFSPARYSTTQKNHVKSNLDNSCEANVATFQVKLS